MKRILINATQEEETRVALVDGQRLYNLDIETASRTQTKSNIYKGVIGRVEPSLEAAFVDYGGERHGFLPLKEISSEYFRTQDGGSMKDLLKEGQEIVVQVVREERGNKGAALTTFLSLAGRFLVLMPNSPGSGGISRRIDFEARKSLQKIVKELTTPEGTSYIVRTAGVDRSYEELEWDLNYLQSIWHAIKVAAVSNKAPVLIYQEGNAITRTIRDHLTSDIGEVIIDSPSKYEDLKDFIEKVMPHNIKKIKLYDPVPTTLFSRYQIESQIESAYAHQVTLPSGGSMVIDHTEALISIDINSSRATKGENIEITALNTNIEAADEIARQLRIRDIGGLIVIDFIDMSSFNHQKDVETRLQEALSEDKARIQVGKISRFGLLEMSRQRLRPPLEDATQLVCPRCSGLGQIRSLESISLTILRMISEEARKDSTAKVLVFVPAEVNSYILNEKREVLNNVESSHLISVVLITNPKMQTPAFEIIRVRSDELSKVAELIKETLEKNVSLAKANSNANAALAIKPAEPLVKNILPDTPPPKKRSNLIGKIIRFLKNLFSNKQKRRPQKSGYKKRYPQQNRNNVARNRSPQGQSSKQAPRNDKAKTDQPADKTKEDQAGKPQRRRNRPNNQRRKPPQEKKD
jgi:ribonuclease E